MKLFRSILKIIFFLSVIILFNLNSGCKDPSEYKPPADSLLSPPDPPQPISPINGFVFMVECFPGMINIPLEWTSIEDAEDYQLEYRFDTFPSFIKFCETNVCTIFIRDTSNRLCNHYWRVRAHSSAWKWYTEWSDQWYLELGLRPSGPQHLYPPNNTTFYVDSLPGEIEVQWNTVQDAEYYEVKILEDSLFYDQRIIYGTSYTVFAYDTASYSWQVRAGSSMWQDYSYWSGLWYFQVRYGK